MARRAFEYAPALPTRCALVLASVLLGACTLLAPAPPAVAESEAPPAPAPIVVLRSPDDIQRIRELEAQLSDVQRQLGDRQKQLTDRQKQASDERTRLEALLKESQQRGSELQMKLDAILAIDRELRRGPRSAE